MSLSLTTYNLCRLQCHAIDLLDDIKSCRTYTESNQQIPNAVKLRVVRRLAEILKSSDFLSVNSNKQEGTNNASNPPKKSGT